MAPRVGFEPTTLRLTAGCSTAELTRNKIRKFSSQIPCLCPLQVLDLAAVFSVETCTVALPLSYRGILCGNDLSSRQVTLQVLSARQSLTSVFGMRTGGPLRYHHHNGYIICILIAGYIRLFQLNTDNCIEAIIIIFFFFVL